MKMHENKLDFDPFKDSEEKEHRLAQMEDETKRLHNDIKSVMKTEYGRRVMMEILELSGLNATISNSDAFVMAMASGRRDLGLYVKALLEVASPEEYDLMIKENRHGK